MATIFKNSVDLVSPDGNYKLRGIDLFSENENGNTLYVNTQNSSAGNPSRADAINYGFQYATLTNAVNASIAGDRIVIIGNGEDFETNEGSVNQKNNTTIVIRGIIQSIAIIIVGTGAVNQKPRIIGENNAAITGNLNLYYNGTTGYMNIENLYIGSVLHSFRGYFTFKRCIINTIPSRLTNSIGATYYFDNCEILGAIDLLGLSNTISLIYGARNTTFHGSISNLSTVVKPLFENCIFYGGIFLKIETSVNSIITFNGCHSLTDIGHFLSHSYNSANNIRLFLLNTSIFLTVSNDPTRKIFNGLNGTTEIFMRNVITDISDTIYTTGAGNFVVDELGTISYATPIIRSSNALLS